MAKLIGLRRELELEMDFEASNGNYSDKGKMTRNSSSIAYARKLSSPKSPPKSSPTLITCEVGPEDGAGQSATAQLRHSQPRPAPAKPRETLHDIARITTERIIAEISIDTVRAVEVKGLALLVPRGVSNFPDQSMRLSGTIDVWWVIHDGGMLILLSFLLQQHKVWKGCRIRIFTVAEMTDNSIQIKKDLEMYLYQIRITAEVHVEEMYGSDISAYTVEKTMDMERRLKMMRELHKSDIAHPVSRHHSINVASIIRHHDTDGSTDHHESPLLDNKPTSTDDVSVMDRLTVPSTNGNDEDSLVHFTFSPHDGANSAKLNRTATRLAAAIREEHTIEEDDQTAFRGNLLRMHTAVQLNQAIKNKSSAAQIVIVNFPAPPAKTSAEENYMEYLEVLGEGLERVLMVRGSGKEVVTMYS